MAIIVGIIIGVIVIIALANESFLGKIGLFLAGTIILTLIGGTAFSFLWTVSRVLFLLLVVYLIALLFMNIFK